MRGVSVDRLLSRFPIIEYVRATFRHGELADGQQADRVGKKVTIGTV